MPQRPATVLVVLEPATRLATVSGTRECLPRMFTVVRWPLLRAARPVVGRLAAIVFEAGGSETTRRRRRQRLERLAPGVPLLPFRAVGPGPPAARARPARGAEEDMILVPPLQPIAVLSIAARERRIEKLRRHTARVLGAVRHNEARLRALATIVRATGRELDPRRIVEAAMSHVRSALRLRGWIVLLLDPDQGLLVVDQASGEGVKGLKGRRVLPGEGLAGLAVQSKRPVLAAERGGAVAPGGATDPRRGLTRRSALAVPLMSRGRVIGAVEMIGQAGQRRLRREDALLACFLIEPAAVALDNALLLRRSEELSITDDLTKLYNSRFLNTTLRREVERSRRYGVPVSLIFLDLDGFKEVNDRHGHLAGSRTLVEVGAVLRRTVRGIDVVSRFGGDEFTVILPQTGSGGARIIAERIRRRIAESTFLAAYGLKVRITASIGIACFPEHGTTKDDLIARADQAMYVVKGRGKNSIALAEAEPAGSTLRIVAC